MTQTSRKSTRRYWRRTQTPKAWSPWGIAPLVGLGMLFLFGALFMAPRIEAEVRDQVSRQLDGSGISVTGIRSDGQGVTIDTSLRPGEDRVLKALAVSTQCETWAGQLACPTSVDIHPSELGNAPALLVEPSQEIVVEQEIAVERSEDAEQAVEEGPEQIGSGTNAIDDVHKCDIGFDEILSSSAIRFPSGSASIDAGNDELLASLAKLAGSCPGPLMIQGHTDNQGDADKNQALSLARAIAVRDALASRGIEASRLSAAGFGESSPIAENDTSAGRARNRRIEIIVDDMN